MTEVLPQFELLIPTDLDQALAAFGDNSNAVICAGGTDMVVQLRLGLSETAMLIDISGLAELQQIAPAGEGLRIGAGVTLATIEADAELARDYPALVRAAAQVAGPTHRSVATLGGNLCLDTRCLYYNQSHWWRKSNAFCLKYRGDTCHVAPNGNRCRAAYSGDLAPALMVHGAEIELASAAGTRRMPLAEFYQEDGADHLKLIAGEIVVAVHLPAPGAVSDYGKIRVRDSIDFPLAGVAVARVSDADGSARFRVAVTGTNSMPVLVPIDAPLTPNEDAEAFFSALGKAVQKAVSPQRTTTIAPHYRRLSAAATAIRMARALR
ncbi:4-hydroxybenzoyl-CoA reductase subunit beta [Shimia sp.]|uniref:4-hydroxybenzoyl-CoA reductase subunit beta n=1 Tax=Shimia sp. TaxID=1954381 RepID=UPI003562A798